MPISRTRPGRRRAVALAAALAVSACSPTAPTVAPTPGPASSAAASAGPTAVASQAPASDVYKSIRQAVEAIRGLEPTADVDPVTIDAQQLRTNLTEEFDKENSADALAFSQDSLILLG